MGKGKLHLIFVGVGKRDYSVVRPHWASHPLPFLDYRPVGLKDALADAGERLATPSLLARSPRNKSSKDMAFPHPKSRSDHYGNNDKPNTAGVLWNFFKRTVNITEYRNAKNDGNPATIDRLVASFMNILPSIYRRHPLIYSGLALNCPGRFQSLRAKTCSRAAENPCHR